MSLQVVEDPRLKVQLIKSGNSDEAIDPNFPLARHNITFLVGRKGVGKTSMVQQIITLLHNYGVHPTHLIHVAKMNALGLDQTTNNLIEQFNIPNVVRINPVAGWTQEVSAYAKKLHRDYMVWRTAVSVLWERCTTKPEITKSDLDLLGEYIVNPVPNPEIVFWVDDMTGSSDLQRDETFAMDLVSARHLHLWTFISLHRFNKINTIIRDQHDEMIIHGGHHPDGLRLIFKELTAQVWDSAECLIHDYRKYIKNHYDAFIVFNKGGGGAGEVRLVTSKKVGDRVIKDFSQIITPTTLAELKDE